MLYSQCLDIGQKLPFCKAFIVFVNFLLIMFLDFIVLALHFERRYELSESMIREVLDVLQASLTPSFINTNF
jgi:hypothetical protein